MQTFLPREEGINLSKNIFLTIIISYNNLLLRWELKIKKNNNKTWFNRQMLIGLLFRFMWQVWQNFTRFIFVNGVFWARTARVTWSWSRVWSSYYIWKLCYGFDCTLWILIISSFWESLHVEPLAAILNEGWQLLKGFQTVCNCVWDLLRNSCTGKNDSWQGWKTWER